MVVETVTAVTARTSRLAALPVGTWLFASLLFLVVAVGGCPSVHAHLRAAALLTRLAGGPQALATLYDSPIVTEELSLRSEYGLFRARIYRPRDGRPRRGLVLAHGIHYMGIDEPRLIPFAQQLARSGVVVLTPQLAALTDYRLHPSSIAEIRAAARHLARLPYVQSHGVTVVGLSFAGGLALLAAADPSMHGVITRVASIGGHHDLYRVSRFFVTDELDTPRGVVRMRSHDYGLVVFFYAHAERFVPSEQLSLFREALRHILHVDRDAAVRTALRLEGEARTLFEQINRHDKRALAPRVMAVLPSLREELSALSPAGHMTDLRHVQVFLLHGANDDVIPPTEAWAIAREIEPFGNVHVLVTPAIKHVTVEGKPSFAQQIEIVHAIAGIVGE